MAANGDIETGGSAAAAGTIAATAAAAADGDAELDEGDGVDVADEGGGGATRLGGCSGGLASWEASSGGTRGGGWGGRCWGGMASGRIMSLPQLTGIAPGGGDLRAGLQGRPPPQPPLLSPSDILRPPGPPRPFIIVIGVPICRWRDCRAFEASYVLVTSIFRRILISKSKVRALPTPDHDEHNPFLPCKMWRAGGPTHYGGGGGITLWRWAGHFLIHSSQLLWKLHGGRSLARVVDLICDTHSVGRRLSTLQTCLQK